MHLRHVLLRFGFGSGDLNMRYRWGRQSAMSEARMALRVALAVMPKQECSGA